MEYLSAAPITIQQTALIVTDVTKPENRSALQCCGMLVMAPRPSLTWKKSAKASAESPQTEPSTLFPLLPNPSFITRQSYAGSRWVSILDFQKRPHFSCAKQCIEFSTPTQCSQADLESNLLKRRWSHLAWCFTEYNTTAFDIALLPKVAQSSEVHTPRRRRSNYIAEQLCAKDLLKVPTQLNHPGRGSNPYSRRYRSTALTSRPPCHTEWHSRQNGID